MGIIRKLKEKLERKKRSAGLKTALIVYIITAILVMTASCVVLITFFENWKNIVYEVNEDEINTQIEYSGSSYVIEQRRISDRVLGQINILNICETISLFICVIATIMILSHLYFKKKLEEPLAILKLEMEYIGRDDLSFDCSYCSNDEMEAVCNAFNKMRLQLVENRKNLWDLMEDQRELNAAFAHDIRTPMTVMKGYSQMLLKFYPQGKISDEKLLETLEMIDRQADRVERFSETMKEMHSIDEWKIIKKEISLTELMEKLSGNLGGMSNETVSISVVYDKDQDQILHCDVSLIEEVTDNLLSNALRYAQKQVVLTAALDMGKLYLYVKDDGPGFSKEALEKASRPYFTTAREHFGMGLTICKTLCKKHGGSLEVTNSIEGGAIVCALVGIE
ncbi:MAG: HAMP domain-containing histidine kinase [Lachnospiraceae bacterium]|nr:HAMP domain-containing histidine kinase [Lachnospiraceae bacterium]